MANYLSQYKFSFVHPQNGYMCDQPPVYPVGLGGVCHEHELQIGLYIV